MSLWDSCLSSLESEFPSQQFNTWIRTLQAELADGRLVLLAPNRFVIDWIIQHFLSRINELVKQFSGNAPAPTVFLEIGTKRQERERPAPASSVQLASPHILPSRAQPAQAEGTS